MFLLLLWFVPAGKLAAQDLRYSQWHAAQTLVNPAFAGAYGDPRIILNFRDQWPSMPQTYVSYRAAADGYVEAIRSGLGVTIGQDNQGDGLLQATEIGVQYMYQARLGYDWALNFGVNVDYQQFKLNWSDILFYDQISLLTGFNDAAGNPNPTGEAAPGSNVITYTDVGMGLLLYTNNLYAGLSFNHVNTPVISFYGNGDSELPGSINAQVGWFVGGKKKTSLLFNPYALWSLQGGFNQIQTGFYLKKSVLLGGMAFKHNTASLSDVVFLVGLTKGVARFAYSYDLSIGPLNGRSGGAHEVSLMFTIPERAGKAHRDSQKSMLDCPQVL